jgi:hypothetical protein
MVETIGARKIKIKTGNLKKEINNFRFNLI